MLNITIYTTSIIFLFGYNQFNKCNFRYGSQSRKLIKHKFGLIGLVEDHHLIPQQLKHHNNIINFGYDIHAKYNLIMLPNKLGYEKLKTNRLLHFGGHKPYNNYVKTNLDLINNQIELKEFCKYLKYSMFGNPDNIPWN